MNRQNTKKLLPIIEAFANGKDIEYKANSSSEWEELKDPNFECDLSCYRIKPQPKLVPFTFEDNLLFRDKWLKAKGSIGMFRIMFYGNVTVVLNNSTITYSELLHKFEFEDGSPCGKYINE